MLKEIVPQFPTLRRAFSEWQFFSLIVLVQVKRQEVKVLKKRSYKEEIWQTTVFTCQSKSRVIETFPSLFPYFNFSSETCFLFFVFFYVRLRIFLESHSERSFPLHLIQVKIVARGNIPKSRSLKSKPSINLVISCIEG